MNKEVVKGLWDKQKGKLKQVFANLTDDDLLFVEGKKDVNPKKSSTKLCPKINGKCDYFAAI
jgi:hypothetical protein